MNTTVQTISVTLEGDTIEIDHDQNQRVEVVEARAYDPLHTTWTYLLYTLSAGTGWDSHDAHVRANREFRGRTGSYADDHDFN